MTRRLTPTTLNRAASWWSWGRAVRRGPRATFRRARRGAFYRLVARIAPR